jgi:hypothetical protein
MLKSGKYLYVCNMGYYRCSDCGQRFCVKCADNGKVPSHLEVEEAKTGVKGSSRRRLEMLSTDRKGR